MKAKLRVWNQIYYFAEKDSYSVSPHGNDYKGSVPGETSGVNCRFVLLWVKFRILYCFQGALFSYAQLKPTA